MQRPHRAWFLLVALLALVPAGLRVLTWSAPRPQPVDPAMARAGAELFKHDWTPNDPLARGGDGLGPVFNATSCVACHHQAGAGGAGGLKHNVTTFTVREVPGRAASEGVVHARSTWWQAETLAHVDPSLPPRTQLTLAELGVVPGKGPPIPMPRGVHVSQRNTPALFGAKLIDELPERHILAQARGQQLRWGMASPESETVPVGRALLLADGRVGRFGWKAQTAGLSDFVQAACANELGLGNPGQAQPRPLGQPGYTPPGLDLTSAQCDQLTAFVASLARPVERLPEHSFAREQAEAGRRLFKGVGCADCHTPDLGDVEGIYSDLLLHRMGQPLVGGGSYGEPPPSLPDVSPGEGPKPDEWRTPPLWGVADSAPYLHDGRAATLEAAIQLHGGQATRAAQRFERLSAGEQAQLVAFLKTLRAP
jgi:CxxC motif-containing protein (DUF1111 family)